jgi:membrane associated rhomboid family serine protease
MEDLAGTAVRVTPARHRADEWAMVLAASYIPHRLRHRGDGWALIVDARDVEAAREALDAFDRENVVNTTDVSVDAVAPVRGAAAVGIAVGLLLIGFFAATGTRASRSVWFERGGAAAERIVAGEWWRTVTALTLHADAPHVVGNAAASVLLVGAVSHELGPGVGLWLLLLAGAGGNALTAVVYGTSHNSVGASTAMFGAIGILAATRGVSSGRRPAARKRWMVATASLALLALLGTSPGADLLAHLFGLLLGGALGVVTAAALLRSLRAPAQWALAGAVLALVVGAWLRALS